MTDKKFTLDESTIVGGVYVKADELDPKGSLLGVTTPDGTTYWRCEDGRFRTKPTEIDLAFFTKMTGLPYPMKDDDD